MSELRTLLHLVDRLQFHDDASVSALIGFDMEGLRATLAEYAILMRDFDGYLAPYAHAVERLHAAADDLDPRKD